MCNQTITFLRQTNRCSNIPEAIVDFSYCNFTAYVCELLGYHVIVLATLRLKHKLCECRVSCVACPLA